MIKQMVMGLMLAGAATLAMANDASSMGAGNFKDLDANGDGRVSTTEAQSHAQLNEGFRTADTNGDGYVSETEFNAWTPSAMPAEPATPASEPATPATPSDPATTPQATTP